MSLPANGYIITKCLNGEPEAFGFLMGKYKGSVYAFAYSRLRNSHNAEDDTQEVSSRLMRHRGYRQDSHGGNSETYQDTSIYRGLGGI